MKRPCITISLAQDERMIKMIKEGLKELNIPHNITNREIVLLGTWEEQIKNLAKLQDYIRQRIERGEW